MDDADENFGRETTEDTTKKKEVKKYRSLTVLTQSSLHLNS